VLLSLDCEGFEGWGECVAGETPAYAYETTDTAWHVLTDLILPNIVGTRGRRPRGAAGSRRLDPGAPHGQGGRGDGRMGRRRPRRGRVAFVLLGGTRKAVPVGVSVGLQPSDDKLVERIASYAADGYARVKIKIKPGRDIEMLSAVRSSFPDLQIMADANSAYTLADTERLRALDALDLMMIEQPLGYDDFLHHARLQKIIETPVCLDESIRSEGDLELALELGSCRIVNIKPGRVGGSV
jgi:o-succinylbenzoate synthase